MRTMRPLLIVTALLAFCSAKGWAQTATPTDTPTVTPTATPTPTVTPTRTLTNTEVPRSTPTARSESTATPVPTATSGTVPKQHSHVTALEMTILGTDAANPRYAADCVAKSYSNPLDPSLCRCVIYVTRQGGVDTLRFKCPDGVEHTVDDTTP